MTLDDSNYQIVNQAFPHIGNKIYLLWGTELCAVYINQTLMDTRNGTRRGFPVEVATALLRIAEDHNRQFKAKKQEPDDIWRHAK